MSFLRSTILTNPSSVKTPMSPVRKKPWSVKAAAFAASLFQ
jgi:hypothetical protein